MQHYHITLYVRKKRHLPALSLLFNNAIEKISERKTHADEFRRFAFGAKIKCTLDLHRLEACLHRLEIELRVKSHEGSNPSLSAKKPVCKRFLAVCRLFFIVRVKTRIFCQHLRNHLYLQLLSHHLFVAPAFGKDLDHHC